MRRLPGPARARSPDDLLIDDRLDPIPHGRSAVHEIGRYMPRLFVGAVAAAVAELSGGLIFREPALLAASLLSTAFGLMIVVVGRLLELGHDQTASTTFAASLFSLGLLSAALIPGAGATPAMLPILSVVLLLPGRSRPVVAAIVAVALAGSGLALVLAQLHHLLPPMREPLASIFAPATVLVVAVLILGALTDFATQAQRSLDGLRRALRSHDDAFAERTAMVASLGRLERRDTVKATAELIVAALMRLQDIHISGVFAYEEGRLEILAMDGPPSLPMHQGDFLPPARARYLLDRMAAGPWAERSAVSGSSDTYAEAFVRVGIKGQAYAPFFDGGEVIGVVAIGTMSEVHVAHLIAELPAVAEFAATASLLLAPLLVGRRETAVARRSIQAIISEHAYRPVFQPVVDLRTSRPVGFEALTRFADGRRPDHVFEAAAKAGLGLELELDTLAVAIRAGHELPPRTWLSLNVSPALVLEATGLAGVLAERDRPVVLEITEHVAIDDYPAIRAALALFGADIRVAVDDAGAGIANFSHLVELRPGLVKVDASLIRDVDSDLARQAAVVGLVHFAAKAGCEVIAEGIETEAERQTAHALGVTHGQGFLIARPAAVATFARPTAVSRAPRRMAQPEPTPEPPMIVPGQAPTPTV